MSIPDDEEGDKTFKANVAVCRSLIKVYRITKNQSQEGIFYKAFLQYSKVKECRDAIMEDRHSLKEISTLFRDNIILPLQYTGFLPRDFDATGSDPIFSSRTSTGSQINLLDETTRIIPICASSTYYWSGMTYNSYARVSLPCNGHIIISLSSPGRTTSTGESSITIGPGGTYYAPVYVEIYRCSSNSTCNKRRMPYATIHQDMLSISTDLPSQNDESVSKGEERQLTDLSVVNGSSVKRIKPTDE